MKAFNLTFLLCMVIALTTAQVTIYYISSSATSIARPVYSSYQGGTMIYIKVTGHNRDASANLITVGPYPCKVPSDGVTDTFIACETSATGLQQDIYNLRVTVLSAGQKAVVTTSSSDIVHYTSTATPQLNEIFPSSGFGGTWMNLSGIHRIDYIGDGRVFPNITSLKIGNDICSLFDIAQSSIPKTSTGNIICITSNLQEAGKYNITEWLYPGIALNSPNLRRASLKANEYYQYANLPSIKSVTPAFGNIGGQYITIKGDGFSLNSNNIIVTVDNNPCKVTASDSHQISCTLALQDNSLSSKLDTDSASPQQPYLSGAGATYTRYKINTNTIYSISLLRSAYKSNTLGTPVENGYRAELKSGDYYGTNYGQIYTGYFKAPATGTYTFRGVTDDHFSFWLATVHGSVELPNSPLISSTTVQNRNNFYIVDVPTAQASVSLTQGNSYYFQLYHINFIGPGWFTIQVDVPNSDNKLPMQSFGVQKIITNAPVQMEVVQYTVQGGVTGDAVNLKIIRTDPKTGSITYNVNSTYVWGADANGFTSFLNKFNSFNGYNFTVSVAYYDSNGATLPSLVSASKIVYTVSIYYLRPSAYSAEDFKSPILSPSSSTMTIQKRIVTAHSPLMSGNFTVSIGGVNLVNPATNDSNFNYDVSAASLQTAFRKIVNFQQVVVDLSSPIGPGYTSTWIVNFIGYNQAVPLITVSGAGLSGGSTGSPEIQASVRRTYSSSITFNPVDYRFLGVPSASPNVQVKVNDMPSICTGDCQYAFQNLAQVSSISITGSKLTIEINDITNLQFTSSDVSVTVQSRSCVVDTTTPITALECALPTNLDGTPILTAGSITPIVSIANVGIAQITTGVVPPATALTATLVSPSTGGNNGGIEVTITGNGYPNDIKKVTVTICSKNALISSVTNQQIKFTVPSCANIGSESITITVGQITDNSQSFTYTDGSTTAPTITSVAPNSWNPTLKGRMVITGSNFGNDNNTVKVWLTNSTGKIYPLRIITITDTSITAGIPGGNEGTYTVLVKTTAGDSLAGTAGSDSFSYGSTITSISPTSGSYNGGTLVTITGTNFADGDAQTIVFFGNTINWICDIQTITPTSITCLTPPLSPDQSAGSPIGITITSRLTYDAKCDDPANCPTFTYNSAADSPSLTAASTTSAASSTAITLTGTLFTMTTACNVNIVRVSSGKSTMVAASSCSGTTAVFNIPSTVPSGKYKISVVGDYGQSNNLPLTVLVALGSLSSNSGSVGGRILTTTGGSGYPTSWPDVDFTLTLVANSVNYPINIISSGVNTISIAIPPVSAYTIFQLSIGGGQNINSKNYVSSYTYSPAITLTSSSQISAGANTLIFTQNNVTTSVPTYFQLVSSVDSTIVLKVPSNDWTAAGSTFTVNINVNAGSYKFRIGNTQYGNFICTSTLNVALPADVTLTPISTSFLGGVVSIQGNYLSPASYISVNGFKGKLLQITDSQANYVLPALVTSNSQSEFNLASISMIDSSQFTLFSDLSSASPPVTNNIAFSFDGSTSTTYSSNASVCFIGVDAGSGLQIKLDRIKFFGNIQWANVANMILGAKFQGSNDKTTWTTLATVDQTIHTGWNVVRSSSQTPYRYLRFLHNSTSQCQLAEIQVYGLLLSTLSANLAGQVSDVIYYDGFNTKTFTGGVTYNRITTPIVNTVTPAYGDVYGGYTITLNGQNFVNAGSSPFVSIDGHSCTVTSTTATSIQCSVAQRLTLPSQNSFIVRIGTANAIIRQSFNYVQKWSDARTWGSDLPPIDGDLISIPKGMNLMIDQDTPQLAGILVQKGSIMFPNDPNLSITVKTGFITLNKGRFIAGTEANPLQTKLTFIMSGDYYDSQQPMFGNKGIGCMSCSFSMYGIPRTPTWTTISTTITPGSTTLTVSEDVDWQPNEMIVVASTSYEHSEAEQKKIVSITGRTITVDSPFTFKHFSGIQTFFSDSVTMRAEVGLLTRNIKMMGDSYSDAKKYGSHLMLAGTAEEGLEGHIAYSQFTQCGQPRILGRYCIHFHMAGAVPTSYVRGNAVHDSHARVVTIHGVYFLTVEKNVGYRVHGHNYFVEDGIETHNVIRNNLAISSLTVTNMLQTDISVASFWITNPTNDFYGNHAAGSDFYGIWYQIKPNPDGPSATNDVCPMGNPLGLVANNVAHSNTRFGLRIFKLFSRMYPCSPIRSSDPNDPWSANPTIQSVYHNFTIYKNKEDGVLAEQTGNVMFSNFTVVESLMGGFEFYLGNFSKDATTVINSVVVGQSMQNGFANGYAGTSGIITPRSGPINLTNIRFYNFPAGTYSFTTCSHCDNLDLFTNTGQEVFVKQLQFFNVQGNYLRMLGLQREIIYDLDGSISTLYDGTARQSCTIMKSWNHLLNSQTAACNNSPLDNTKWDGGMLCDETVTIRRIIITNLIKLATFSAQPIKVTQLQSMQQTIPANAAPTSYSSAVSRMSNMEPMIEKPNAYSLPYITGQIYAVWWGSGLDFSHISIYTTPMFAQADEGVILKFNYSQNRELFHVGAMRSGVLLDSSNYIAEQQSGNDLATTTCGNGDYFHNNENSSARHLAICQSGKNRAKFEYTEVNGVICQYLCPDPSGTFTKEAFTRKWSNQSQWPGQKLPKAGDNVTINGNWTLIMDMNPEPINFLRVDGTLIVDDTMDLLVQAKSVFVSVGSIKVFGAAAGTTPFTHKFTLQINGNKQEFGYVIDPIVAGNKFFVNTGTVQMYGKIPATVQTQLKATARIGSTTIQVVSSSGWQVGDQLGLSPSFNTPRQFEAVTITNINADGSTITITPALKYNHYGSGSVLTTPNGDIDLRTQVAHLTRNVKIIAGPDNGWGFKIINYGFFDIAQSKITNKGSITLSGVQIDNGGQYDTDNAPLMFLNTMNPTTPSSISYSSFTNCKAKCISVDTSSNITIDKNVFFSSRVFHVEVLTAQAFKFTNNLMIGVTEKPSLEIGSELVACFATYSYVDPASSDVSVKNNFCSGSDTHGYVFPYIKCSQIQTNPWAGNTAGSTGIGFIFNQDSISGCIAFSYINAFASKIGQIATAPGADEQIFDHFILVDNKRGGTMRFGTGREGTNNHTGTLQNSFISAVSRPTCVECYESGAIDCSDNHGIRMLSVTVNGERLPQKFGAGIDTICRQQIYGMKAFLFNVTFDNFRKTYSGAALAQCGNNFVFRPHTLAHDAVASHNLFNTVCINCQNISYALCDPNAQSELGWFGGCGDILCTGKKNYLINDQDGKFFGFVGTLMPNNQVGGNSSGCTFSSEMNGYLCTRRDWGVLEYQSIAPDFNTRIMWPVNVIGQGLNYTYLTNGWRQWDWLGKEPQNRRFGRFVSIVQYSTVYNLSFASMPPLDMQFQLQYNVPGGKNSNYIVVTMYYPLPNSIRVQVNGTTISPIFLRDDMTNVKVDTTKCGSNIFFFKNYTITFVVTEDVNCLVRVTLTDTIQLTTRFNMNINDFFSDIDNKLTTFVDRICALLSITDRSRVKVVGVMSGSAKVSATISSSSHAPAAPGSDPTMAQTKDKLAGMIGSGALDSDLANHIGPVSGSNANYIMLPTSSPSQSSNIGLIIGVSVASVAVVVVVFTSFIYCLRKRAKIVEQLRASEDEFHNQMKSIDKNDDFGSHLSEIKIEKAHHEGLDS